MKYFRMSWDEVLWVRSWSNVVMLSATVPKYKKSKTEVDKEETREITSDVDGVAGLEQFFSGNLK